MVVLQAGDALIDFVLQGLRVHFRAELLIEATTLVCSQDIRGVTLVQEGP